MGIPPDREDSLLAPWALIEILVSRPLRTLATQISVLLLLLLVSSPALAQGNFDFPGAVVVGVRAPARSLVAVPGLPQSDRYLVAGTDDGFLVLTEFRPEIGKVVTLGRYFIGGIPVAMSPDPLAEGSTDLVVACRNPDRLVFLEVTLSSPNFHETQALDLEEDPSAISSFHFGLGGEAGLVVSLPGIDRILILGKNQGTWGILQDLPSGDRPQDLATGDLDSDGQDEIYVSQQGYLSENIGIFKQNETGQFFRDSQYNPGFFPGPVETFDFDGNGVPNLVLGAGDQPVATVLEMVAGSLLERDRITLNASVSGLKLVTLADGTVDLFTANTDLGLVDLAQNSSGSWELQQPYYPGCLPLEILPQDFNGDGLIDLITAGEPAGFTVMFGVNEQLFWGFHALPLGGVPLDMALGDIDRDGISDALTIYRDNQVLKVNVGSPSGGFQSQQIEVPLGFFLDKIVRLEPSLAGSSPVVVYDSQGSRLLVLEIMEDYSPRILGELNVSGFLTSLRSGDFDGDGHGDLLVLMSAERQITVFFGDGTGHFPQQVVLGIPALMADINFLDLNQDHFLDIVVGGKGRSLGSFLNQGGRSFAAAQWLEISSNVDQLIVGDFDGDQDHDLVAADEEGQTLTMLENNGTGGLLVRIDEYPLLSSPVGVVAADVNADGRPEILVNLRAEGQVGVVLVGENWEYGVTLDFPSSSHVDLMASGDFNLDNINDLLVLDGTLQLGLVMLNQKRSLVAIDPGALTSYCTEQGPRFEIAPENQGFWELAGQNGEQWMPLARSDWAVTGNIAYDRGIWIWDPEVSLSSLLGAEPGIPVLLRLTAGEGAQEDSLVVSWLDPCSSGEPSPRGRTLSWARRPWPNPFNPTLSVSVQVLRPSELLVQVFDLRGRVVATLFQGRVASGKRDMTWNGQAPSGPAPSGLYFIRAQTESDQLVGKVQLVR